MDTAQPGASPETWISIDVETSGPSPSVASLLSIGACVVGQPDQAFYVELRPVPGLDWLAEAEAIHTLTRDYLAEHGTEPAEAMHQFADWIAGLPSVEGGGRPVFVGFNAPFDWMFVADYFWRFHGSNPLGVSALDIKALYLGMAWPEVREWTETTRSRIEARNPGIATVPLTHDALDDARQQADLIVRLLARPGETKGTAG